MQKKIIGSLEPLDPNEKNSTEQRRFRFEMDRKDSIARIYLSKGKRQKTLVFETLNDSWNIEEFSITVHLLGFNLKTLSFNSIEDFEMVDEFEFYFEKRHARAMLKLQDKSSFYFSSNSIEGNMRIFSMFLSTDKENRSIWVSKLMEKQSELFLSCHSKSWKEEKELIRYADIARESLLMAQD